MQILCIFILLAASAEAWLLLPHTSHGHNTGVLYAFRNDNNKGGYQFGDFTRGAINRFQGRVNSLTGKRFYQFGDLSRWLDSQAKQRVQSFTNMPDYQFGDITKEILRRLLAGEYSRDDLLLLLKIVATVGINFQPVAQVLPIRVLMDLLNLSLEVSIAQSVGDKVIAAITNEIDGRMKEMVTGDRNYQLGDYTKRIIVRWTGKESYEFGDVTRTILGKLEARDGGSLQIDAKTAVNSKPKDEQSISNDIVLELDKTEQDVLEAWDEEFLKFQRETEGLAALKNDDIYRDWDERYLSSEQERPDKNERRK